MIANSHNAKECFDAGVKARGSGFFRYCPYYEQPRAEYWWLAGFDGTDFFEADKLQPEFSSGDCPSVRGALTDKEQVLPA